MMVIWALHIKLVSTFGRNLLEIFTLNIEEAGATETSGYTHYTMWCKWAG